MYRETVLILTVSISALTAAPPLTLENAVAEALAHNRQVQAAGIRADEVKAQIGVAESRRYPVMRTQSQFGVSVTRADVTFPQGALGNYPGTGPIPGTDTKVGIPRQLSGFAYSQVALPLTQQLRTGAAIDGAKLQYEEARTGKKQAEAEIARQVRQTYFSLLALDAALQAAKSNLDVAAEVERLAAQGVEAGNALRVEQQEAVSRSERARAALRGTEMERDNLRDAFNQLLGRPLETPVELAGLPALAAGELTPESVRMQARESRPELQAAQLRIRQSEAAVKGKRYEFIPDVSLSFTHFGFLNTGNLAPSNYAVAGLALDWEPWDWGRKKSELRGLRYQADRVRLELEERRQDVAREALRAWREWRQSEVNLNAAESAVTARAEMVSVMKRRYTEQAALLRQLLEAQADYETAQEQRVRTLAARGSAWANLQFAMGAQ